ncbi:hypothetical protein AALP_AA6G195000 [Arabis alpina]|uniref:Uncharacterized protein n=1 Tax=Arabis alpina TaxID=50452 RepID=A0A087GQB3_ARAAL|nr:hypothetical protein AALP_AA6G195000 [Arabis alpina]
MVNSVPEVLCSLACIGEESRLCSCIVDWFSLRLGSFQSGRSLCGSVTNLDSLFLLHLPYMCNIGSGPEIQ